MSKLEWGPKTTVEILLTLNEEGELFYQFTGMDGGPANPGVVMRVLAMTHDAIVRQIQPPPEVQMNNITTLEREPQ